MIRVDFLETSVSFNQLEERSVAKYLIPQCGLYFAYLWRFKFHSFSRYCPHEGQECIKKLTSFLFFCLHDQACDNDYVRQVINSMNGRSAHRSLLALQDNKIWQKRNLLLVGLPSPECCCKCSVSNKGRQFYFCTT